jgi:hypothetical protein
MKHTVIVLALVLSGCAATRDAIVIHNTTKNIRGLTPLGVQEELLNKVKCVDPARQPYCS